MSYYTPALVSVGGGTIVKSTSGSTIAITPISTVRAYDLVIAVGYTSVDATQVADAGDGWVLLDAGYDSVNSFGIFIMGCIAVRNGTGYAGLTLPTAGAYTAIPIAYRIPPPYRFDLSLRASSTGWFNATASATALDAPAILQPYAQCIDIIARGYNNGGTTTTVAAVTGFTERQDNGQISPPHGVVINERTVKNASQNPAVTSALAVAKTNRAGVRAMIGIVGNTTNRGRYMSSRRVGG